MTQSTSLPASTTSWTVRDVCREQPRLVLAAALILCLSVIGIYTITAAAYINHDCFVIARVAQSVVSGKPLYSACWDNKPPLGILCYAIPQLVLPGSYSALQAFLGVWLMLQVAAFVYFMRDEGWLSVVVGTMMLVMLPLLDKEFTWASTEHWQNLFVLLTVLPMVRLVRTGQGRGSVCLMAGASLLLAIHCRQSAAPLGLLPFVVIATLPGQFSLRSKAWMLGMGAVGAILGELMILALTAQVGSISSYVDAMFLAPARYTQKSDSTLFGAGYFFVATTRSSGFILMSVVGLMATWGRRDWGLLATFGVLSLLMILTPAKPYPHYLVQLFPFIAIATQGAMTQMESSSRQVGRRLSLALTAFLCLNAGFSIAALPAGRAAHLMHELSATARSLQDEATAGDTLFAVGDDSAYLYFATSIDNAHPIFWDMFFGRLATTIPYPIEQVMEQYGETPPSLLVLRDEVHELASHPEEITRNASPTYLSVVLSQKLLSQNHYQIVGQSGGWKILRRQAGESVASLRASRQVSDSGIE